LLQRGKGRNYRPISLIFNVAKIFEKITKTKLTSSLETHNFFSNAQFGFREGKGANQAIAKVTNTTYICNTSDKNKNVPPFI